MTGRIWKKKEKSPMGGGRNKSLMSLGPPTPNLKKMTGKADGSELSVKIHFPENKKNNPLRGAKKRGFQ